MAIDTAQKRMSAINPACPWRGPMVDAAESGFGAGNRGAAAYQYSMLFEAGGGGSSAPIGYFPHRHFTLRYFPDRYFPGTGTQIGSGTGVRGRHLEWCSIGRYQQWEVIERESSWASNPRSPEWGPVI